MPHLVRPAERPVVGVKAGRRPVGRPAIAQPAGPPVLFRRQSRTCSLEATGRASAPRGLRQGKANVRKDTERSVAAERSRHSRRSLPTLLHCRQSSSEAEGAAREQRQKPSRRRRSLLLLESQSESGNFREIAFSEVNSRCGYRERAETRR